METVDAPATGARATQDAKVAKMDTSCMKKDLQRPLVETVVNPASMQPLLQVEPMSYQSTNGKHSTVELTGTDGTLYVEAGAVQPTDDLSFRAFYTDTNSYDYANPNTVYMYTVDSTQAPDQPQQAAPPSQQPHHDRESQKVVAQLKQET